MTREHFPARSTRKAWLPGKLRTSNSIYRQVPYNPKGRAVKWKNTIGRGRTPKNHNLLSLLSSSVERGARGGAL